MSGWVLHPTTRVLIRDRREDTNTQKRRPYEEGAETGVMWPQVKERLKHQKLAKEGSESPGIPGADMALPDFSLLASRNVRG